MNSIPMPGAEQLNEKSLDPAQALPETKVPSENASEKVKFTAIDMWNRNRQSRSASDRIRKWNLN